MNLLPPTDGIDLYATLTMACEDHEVPVLPCEMEENSFPVEYESTDLCGVRISKLRSRPSDPLDNLGGKAWSVLGLPELTNDMSVSDNERSANDFVVAPRIPLPNGDLFHNDTE